MQAIYNADSVVEFVRNNAAWVLNDSPKGALTGKLAVTADMIPVMEQDLREGGSPSSIWYEGVDPLLSFPYRLDCQPEVYDEIAEALPPKTRWLHDSIRLAQAIDSTRHGPASEEGFWKEVDKRVRGWSLTMYRPVDHDVPETVGQWVKELLSSDGRAEKLERILAEVD